MDDGTYVSTNADLVKTGYPVMLAYGVNSYPYTITNEDDGFVPGLSNNGGPMRVIFGKTEYGHANGSNQIQYLSNIVVGSNYMLSTHSGTRVDAQQEYAQDKIQIKVNNVDGSVLTDESYKVKNIEDIIRFQVEQSPSSIESFEEMFSEALNLKFLNLCSFKIFKHSSWASLQ